MAKRKSIPKRIRFEVYKRDSFTCQYCGRKAPDVELEIDHIKPVAKGGTNDIMNLVTSCYECNRGKSDKELTDNSVVEKQRSQLEKLQARNEQLEMMLQWREELTNIEDKECNAVYDLFVRETGSGFNDNGKRTIKKLIKSYGLNEVLESAMVSITQYYTSEKEWKNTFDKIEVIVKNRKKSREDPSFLYKNRLCKYATKKFGNINRQNFMRLLNRAVHTEGDEQEIFTYLKENDDWNEVLDLVETWGDLNADYEDYLRWCKENGDKESS